MAFAVLIQGTIGEIQESFGLCKSFEMQLKPYSASDVCLTKSEADCVAQDVNKQCSILITDPCLMQDVIAHGKDYALVRMPYTHDSRFLPVAEKQNEKTSLCTKCGQPLRYENANYCARCGAPVQLLTE